MSQLPAQRRERRIRHVPSPRILVDIIESFKGIAVHRGGGLTIRSEFAREFIPQKAPPRANLCMARIMGLLHGHERLSVHGLKIGVR